MAHVQFEQHQPLKLSPSTQINLLSINLLRSRPLPIRNVPWNPLRAKSHKCFAVVSKGHGAGRC